MDINLDLVSRNEGRDYSESHSMGYWIFVFTTELGGNKFVLAVKYIKPTQEYTYARNPYTVDKLVKLRTIEHLEKLGEVITCFDHFSVDFEVNHGVGLGRNSLVESIEIFSQKFLAEEALKFERSLGNP